MREQSRPARVVRSLTFSVEAKLSSAQWVDEQYFSIWNVEAFVSLCGEQKTIERITHMLTTGKPY